MGKVYNSVIVAADSDRVWNTLRDFHDLSWAPDVVTSVEKVGDADGTTPGARRILNEAFHETLLTHDDDDKKLTYSIDDGPGPVARDAVNEYVGTVRVRPVTDDGTSFVEWYSEYDSRDDAAVGEFCNPIYQALLGALKKRF